MFQYYYSTRPDVIYCKRGNLRASVLHNKYTITRFSCKLSLRVLYLVLCNLLLDDTDIMSSNPACTVCKGNAHIQQHTDIPTFTVVNSSDKARYSEAIYLHKKEACPEHFWGAKCPLGRCLTDRSVQRSLRPVLPKNDHKAIHIQVCLQKQSQCSLKQNKSFC